MKSRSAVILVCITVLLSGCGGPRRINKQPVPTQSVIRSYRLVAEGDKLLEEGKDHLALLKYLEAADLHPYHEVIFNKLAIAYSRLLMYPQARKAVDRSVALNPKYAFAHNTLGIVHLAQQETKQAIKALKRAIQLNPSAASFHINLGHAYMQIDHFEEARTAYIRALELDQTAFAKKDAIQLPYPIQENPDPERQYQMARFFAEMGDRESCLTYLGRALSAGFSDKKRFAAEKAFDKLREDEDFVRLLQMYGFEPGRS